MNRNVVVVCIARMGSTRLPGKVLMPLGAYPVIHWVYRAYLYSDLTHDFWVATTTEKRDDAIAEWAERMGVPCFRGSEEDVLSRVYGCAEKAGATHVMRITGDCPFQDPHVIDQICALQHRTGADYVSNVNPVTWPDGLDCEIISMPALEAAHKEATRHSDRDTVTQFIVRNRYRFSSETLICPVPGLEKERWVLDTKEDLAFCEKVAAYLGDRPHPPAYTDILWILDNHPEEDLRSINDNSARNERFFDALAEEEDIAQRKYDNSRSMLERALKVMPYGSGTYSKSHVAFGARNGPLFLTHGEGGRCFDVDGNDYVDLVGALGPVILGHCDQDVDAAVKRAQCSGSSHSLGTEIEIALAEEFCDYIPCAEKVIFCKGGSDACSIALRCAAAFTGENAPILFVGAYHGWHDWAIAGTVRGHAVTATQYRVPMGSEPDSYGWPIHPSCVIVEPDMHTVAYLHNLRKWCTDADVPLIFDEAVTGFRYPGGSYQHHTDVIPDAACFAKSIANGYALGACVGRAKLLDCIAPGDSPNCFVSGTFFGEIQSIAAGLATIRKLRRLQVSKRIWDKASFLRAGIHDIQMRNGIDNLRIGPEPRNLHSWRSPLEANAFRKHMGDAGALIYNAHNLMYAHTEADMRHVLSAYDYAFRRIKAGDIDYPVALNTIMRR